ncbi:MAG: hypothetical protein AB1332_09520 [Pseudomonadota bacterium]
MQSILIFASLALGLGLTLLTGPQWGSVMALLAYLAGSHVLLNQEVNKLRAYIDRIINELPELLQQMSLKVESQAAAPTSPPQQTGKAPAEPANPLEQRMQALDSKLELLLQRIQSPAPEAASMPSPPPKIESAAQTATQPAPITPSPSNAPTPAAKDLELIRELLLKMAETMATREAGGDHAAAPTHQTPTPQASSADPAKGHEATGQRLSIDDLRAELDKIAQELSIELGRPKP